MHREFDRIVVSRTDRIGDVVLSLPVFASLKRCFPGSELTALVSEYAADVAASFESVDGVVAYNKEESIFVTARKLRRLKPDAILMLYPRFRVSVAAFLARIPVRVGTAFRWYSFLFNIKIREHRKESIKSEADYNLSLAKALGCDAALIDVRLRIDPSAEETVDIFLQRRNIGRFIVIHPGSGGSASEWGAEKFRELCRRIEEVSDANIIITGTEPERALCEKVAGDTRRCINAAGMFHLKEFIALLSKAAAFISNSTGPIHLAAGVGTPVVGLYPNRKPMTPKRWAPLTEKRNIITPDDGTDDLSGIPVDRVLTSILELVPVSN